jgi:hypothetical protein
MADDTANKPYPFQFDPSQFSNKYSPYAGVALPFMGAYNGGATGPTDAHGNPIQSYQDTQKLHDAWAAANPTPAMAPSTTLNSNPTHGVGGLQPGQWDGSNGLATGAPSSFQHATGSDGMPYGQTSLGRGVVGTSWQGPGGGQMPQQQQAAPAAAAQTNPYDMGQAYLQALQNPGHVTTPGATVAQAAPPSNQSGVLQQFMQNWGGNSKGAGNYDNSGFINSLRGMV